MEKIKQSPLEKARWIRQVLQDGFGGLGLVKLKDVDDIINCYELTIKKLQENK